MPAHSGRPLRGDAGFQKFIERQAPALDFDQGLNQ
jgi:hypothetical protein